MESVHVSEAVGMVLCHDITKIVPGDFKGRLFKRGHIITEEDVAKLLDVGKEHIYVWNPKKGYVHEDDAAIRIARPAAGTNVELTDSSEGKIEFVAKIDGLVTIDKDRLEKLNSIDDVMMATIHSNQTVKKGKLLGGTRVIPLVVKEEHLTEAEKTLDSPIIEVLPFNKWKIGMIVTGREVFSGRIEDGFGPVVEAKLKDLNCSVAEKVFVPDCVETTKNEILRFKEMGVDMIVLTGGMSVDPDDLTPSSIRAAGGETVVYGVPTLPGAMFMLSYIGNTPVVGLPGCVMYHKASIFDLVVPRLVAGQTVTAKDLKKLGYGGFCLKCEECIYPNCGFGKI